MSGKTPSSSLLPYNNQSFGTEPVAVKTCECAASEKSEACLLSRVSAFHAFVTAIVPKVLAILVPVKLAAGNPPRLVNAPTAVVAPVPPYNKANVPAFKLLAFL